MKAFATVVFVTAVISAPALVFAQSKVPAKAETAPNPPPPTKPSLAELRQDVEKRRLEVSRLQEAPLPGDEELKKHRAAKATLEETLAQHETRIQQSAPKVTSRRCRARRRNRPRASRSSTS